MAMEVISVFSILVGLLYCTGQQVSQKVGNMNLKVGAPVNERNPQVDVPVDEVSQLVTQLVKEELDGCHLILAYAGNDLPLLYQTVRGEVGVTQVEALTVSSWGEATQSHLFQCMWGEARFSCRALLLHLANSTYTTVLLRLMEAAGLWRHPETHVLVVGDELHVTEVLLHHALRNTLHAIYLAPPHSTSNTLHPYIDLYSSALHGRWMERQWDAGMEAGVKVYRRCGYCHGGHPGVQFLFRWLPLTTTHYPHIFVKGSEDFLGHKFRVVVRRYFPTIDFDRVGLGEDTLAKPRDSLNTRMLQNIATHLNFTYELHEAWDGDWGTEDSTGNWTGLVGTLQHERADFSTTITPTDSRLRVMDHSRIYALDPFVIVSAKSQPLAYSLVPVKPFTREAWVVVAGSCVVAGVVLWLLQMAWTNLTDGQPAKFSTVALYTSGVLLDNPPYAPPRHFSARVFAGWWMLTCLVITAAYRSSLSAHLTVEEKTAPVNSFEDLLKQKGWRWGSELLLGASVLYFNLSTDPTLQEIYSKMEVHGLKENMKLVVEGKYAFITTKFQNDYIVALNYTDRFGHSSIHTSARSYPKSGGTSWGFRKGAPFRRRVAVMTQRMIEAGLIGHWLRDVITQRVLQERSCNPEQRWSRPSELLQTEATLVVLGLHHLSGGFLLLVLGLSLATTIQLGELILARFTTPHIDGFYQVLANRISTSATQLSSPSPLGNPET